MKKLGLPFAVALLLATCGGYFLSGLITEMNGAAQQKSDQLLAAVDGIDDVAIALGHQTQEWKDMLLRVEHQSLLSYYQLAQTLLNPQQELSFREVDPQVLGVDRTMQHHIATVKADMERQSQQRSSAGMPLIQRNRNLLSVMRVGMLMFMALVGFVLASPRNVIAWLRINSIHSENKNSL